MTRLHLAEISKSYGQTRALADFSLALEPGDVVALVGENGAGKSTLGRILAGAESPDSGAIRVDERAIKISSPREAIALGIGYIPQELAPVPTLSLAENLFLGDWPRLRGIVRQEILNRRAAEELAKLGFADVDVRQRADSASVPDLQLIEIAKAVRRQARVVVFDEPTASLSEDEAEKLHQIVLGLSTMGVGVIYISHRMEEVFSFTSRICVLRNGRKVGEHQIGTVTREQVVGEMVGRTVAARIPNELSPYAKPVLTLANCNRQQKPSLKSVSFELRGHEILGLYGLRGSSMDALASILGGHMRAQSGQLWIRDAPVSLPRDPRASRRLGIQYIPADRKNEGLVLQLSVADNVTLPNLGAVSRFGILSAPKIASTCRFLIEKLNIRLRTPSQRVEELSGGNQQKVLLGSRLLGQASVYVLQEPTKGVDVGAREDIYRSLRELATESSGVIIASSDVEEVVSVADRVLVVRQGSIVAELQGSTKTQEAAVSAAALSGNESA